MTDQLSPRARDLLDAARHADDPSTEERARIRARVLAAVATGGLASGASATAAASSTLASGTAASSGIAAGGIASLTAVATKGLLVLALVSAGTAGVVAVSRSSPIQAPVAETSSETQTPTRSSAARSASTASLPTTPATEPAVALPQQESVPPRIPSRATVPSRVAPTPRPSRPRTALAETVEVPSATIEAPSLATELSILRAAQRARAAGDPHAALQHLEEHARDFPLGSLAAERDGTRVLALCDAGEVAAARAAASAFLARHPGSPLRQRVSVACR